VFVHRDVDMCRAQFHDTPAHILQNYQSQIRLSVKMKFLVGLAHKITEAIGTTNLPQVREQLGTLAANAGMVEDAFRHGKPQAASATNFICLTGT
jgi:4-hydroxyphenylacetate 3-monooxygenase